MHSAKHTAILVFANSAQTELSRKPMPKGELLFNGLTQDTLKKVQATGLPYFHISDTQQKGSSFGARFTNAIQEVFESGFENIITIGNDTPQLKTTHLLQANTALQAGKMVLGPSLDGGFYLMGIHVSNFDQNTFKNLPWQRFNLFQQISALLGQADSAVHQLPILNDIDSFHDVKRLASFKTSIASTVLVLLSVVLQLGQELQTILISLFSAIPLRQPYNKGSPLLLHS